MAAPRNRSGILPQILNLPQARLALVELMTASLLINILSLALPLVLMQVYDRIIANGARETLILLVCGCTVAVILECLLRFCREAASAWAGSRFEYSSGNKLFDCSLRVKLDQFEKSSVTEHVERHGALSLLRTFYTGQFVQSLMDFPFAVIYLAALWYIGGALVLLPVFVTIIFLLIILGFRNKFQRNHEEQLTEENKRSDFLLSMLERILTIKSLTLEEQQLRIAENLQMHSSQARLSSGRLSLVPATLGALASQIVLFGLILAGSAYVLNGSITMGALTACAMFGSRAMQPLQNIAHLWLRYSEAEMARKRLEAVGDDPGDCAALPPFPGGVAGRIEVRELTVSGASDAETIRIPGFIAGVRQLIVLDTPLQSAVTAFLQTLNGMRSIQSGEVFLDEYSFQDWDTQDMCGRSSLVSSQSILFSGTLLENITLFCPADNQLALDAAALLKLPEDIALLPLGFETKVDSRGGASLPAGTVQRMAIVRSMVTRPAVLFLDHPEVSMGTKDRDLLIDFLRNLKGSLTIVCATNLKELHRLADEIWVLDNRELVRKSC